MALRTDVPLSGLLVVVLPLMALVIGLVMSRAIPLFRATQAKLDRINQVMRETLAGVRVIRAFVRTRHEEARFDDREPRPVRHPASGRAGCSRSRIPVIIAIFNLSTVAVIWFGAIRVQDGELSDRRPDRVPPVPHPDPVRGPDGGLHVHPRAARGRVGGPDPRGPRHRALDPRSGSNPWSPIRPARSVASSSSADVEFRYPGAEEPGPPRHLVSRRARPRRPRSSAAPAAARSTLINLIPRFYDATAGTVLVDGVDVRTMDREDLWARIGVDPPEGVPVRRDRREQPPLRRRQTRPTRSSGTRSRSPRAATSSSEMDGGLEAPITQGGTNVSGGQRQRLAIARALVKDARDLHLRRQLLGARLRDRRPAAGRARARARLGDA